MAKGYLALVLHAHLPFIRHPEHENFLEENWMFEAITDCYIPLIKVLDNLANDGVDFRLTLSLSPTLISMLRDEVLVARYIRHLDRLLTLASLEVERTRSDRQFNKLAQMYLDNFKAAKFTFVEKYGRDLLAAFKKFQDLEKLEIITCSATHAYLPLMSLYENAVRTQIRVAVETYEKVFNRKPAGFWLPECGFYPGLDKFLREFGIDYFFVESHGILFGAPRPKYGTYSPYLCESQVAVYGRDLESSKAVWSSKEGYPGDYNYREYYRDIGFDLDYDYIKPFINGCGTRINTGIKYYRITGQTNHKELYDRSRAMETAAAHAGNFMFNREKQVEYLSGVMDRAPMIVSPYDAELFGHWWFEGPEWLEFLLRKLHYDQDTVKTITPAGYLKLYDKYPTITPSMSSWGYKGYSEVWLDGSNDWIYRHLHKMAEVMTLSSEQHKDATGLTRRVLNQMARELLLAQSSDWPFIMKTGTFTSYASSRISEHIGRFFALNEQLASGNIDEEMLRQAEDKYNIFTGDVSYSY